jgi:hypothetical protein
MRNFCNCGRRRAGLATLALALVFAGGWIKSGIDRDVLCVPNGNLADQMALSGKIALSLSSDHMDGNQEVPGSQLEIAGLYCDMSVPPSKESKETENVPTLRMQTDVPGVTVDFGAVPGMSEADREKAQQKILHLDESATTPDLAPDAPTTSRWQSCGFYFNRTSTAEGHWLIALFIPHWAIVIPLALLSLALLIKPRAARPQLQALPA